MLCGVCEHCGDTYPLPEGMKEGKKYKCLKCGKTYVLHIVKMDEFVFHSLKAVNPS
jgi:hypothetical protein